MRSIAISLRLLAVLLLMSLVTAGDCDNGEPETGDPDEPGCSAPVYDDAERTVNALVDEWFLYYPHPEDSGLGDPLDFAITAGELPPGLAFAATDGSISGEPTEIGSWTVTVKASRICEEGTEALAIQELTIEVTTECPLIQGPPSWGFVTEVGAPVDESLPHTGGFGTLRYILIGPTPPGLEYDEDTGTYTGAVTEPGTWSALVAVVDECPEEQSVEVTVTITAAAISEAIPADTYACPITAPEGIHYEEQVAFGDIEPPYFVVAGSNSWALLSANAPYFAVLGAIFNPTLGLWGAIPIASGGSCDAPAGRLVCSWGENGGLLTGWNEETDQFNASQGILGTVYDGCKQECDQSAGDSWATVVTSSPPGVRGVHHDESSGFPDYLPGFFQSFHLENGTPITACPLSSGGREFFTCTTAESPEGAKLYHGDFDLTSEPCTPVTELGSQPVRVRENGGWWCVPDNTDDTLTIGRTNDGHDAEVTATVTVGGGPFGCDIEPLGDGTALIACTGYGSDTYSLVHVDGDGAVLSNISRPMPDGQTQPAHCAIFEDAAKVAITCRGSDSIVVEETGF